MEHGIPNELLVVGLGIGAILMLIGIFSIRRSAGGWNLIDLILNRQGSGIGQFFSGLLLILAVIAIFFLKKNGTI